MPFCALYPASPRSLLDPVLALKRSGTLFHVFSGFGDAHQLPGKSALAIMLAGRCDRSALGVLGRGGRPPWLLEGAALCIQVKGSIASPPPTHALMVCNYSGCSVPLVLIAEDAAVSGKNRRPSQRVPVSSLEEEALRS